MARLNFKDISIAYAGATVASVTTGLVGSYIWSEFGYDVDYSLVVSSAWLLTVGVPSCLVSMDTLRRKLGQKEPATVTAAGGGRGRRGIPVSGGLGKTSHLFLSSIGWVNEHSQPESAQPENDYEIDLPTIFTVTIDGNDYSITLDEIEAFIRGAWRRQRRGEAAFSRPYWTRQCRPRLRPTEYHVRLNILLSVNGLILDRSKRRSGRLSVPPMAAIKALQGQFSIT